jgi:hypothetical protein
MDEKEQSQIECIDESVLAKTSVPDADSTAVNDIENDPQTEATLNEEGSEEEVQQSLIIDEASAKQARIDADAAAKQALINEEAAKAARKAAFLAAHYHCLHFRFLDGTAKTFEMDKIETYFDLQQEIARRVPGRKMFIVYNAEKVLVTNGTYADKFQWRKEAYFTVVEQFVAKIPKFFPYMENQWDHRVYHARPEGWIDPATTREFRMAEKRRLQEEERQRLENAELLEQQHRAEQLALKATADKEWAILLQDEDV